MGNTRYSASIIINTYNRASELHRLLASLTHLSGESFEVVVVNGPSTDNTSSVLKMYEGRIKIVDCPTRNISSSRNLGILSAAGDIVVFIDDDALPGDEYWLTRYIEAFQNDATGKLAALGGPVLWHDSDWMEFNKGVTSEYGFQKFGNDYDSLIADGKEKWYIRTPGGNTAFLRKVLVEINGFDEFYKYYLDETDVGIRITKAGYLIDNLPNNPIRHYKSALRVNPHNINWDTIARSDTYFALKNASDPILKRLIKTLWYAPRKHFFKEMNKYYKDHEISFSLWLKIISKWLRGLLEGVAWGIRKSRDLGDFRVPPFPFLTFNSSHMENPLKIALLSQTVPCQPNYGGIGRFIYDLALGLHDRGHEVDIFCKDEQPLRRVRLGLNIHGISKAEQEPIPNFSNRPILQKNIAYSVALVKKLANLYSQGKIFDVVHAPNWDAEGVALIRMQVYPVVLEVVTSLAKVIGTEHLELNEDMQSSLEIDRWQIANADLVTVPSRGICKSYEDLMDVPHDETEHWQVVPLGIVPISAASLQCTNGLKRLLFVGRLEHRKGIQTLLEILPNLMIEFEDWECHLVGDDQIILSDGSTFKSQFLSKYANAPWINRVEFHGKVTEEELNRQYQQCDLFVAPSLQESFGLIYHEAMQYQKAVVGCKTGGVPEVVEDGVEGLLVPPASPKELQEALSRLMHDDSLRNQMGLAGAERVRNRNNYKVMAAGMEKLYREVISAVGESRKARREEIWKENK